MLQTAQQSPSPSPVTEIPDVVMLDVLAELRRGDARMAIRTLCAHVMSAAAAALPDNTELLKKSMPERRQHLLRTLRAANRALEKFCDSPFFTVRA